MQAAGHVLNVYPILSSPRVNVGHHRSRLLTFCIESRKRSTGRATDQLDSPNDPFRQQQWRGPSSSSNSPPFFGNPTNRTRRASRTNREPFDAELLVLFGLPALIILLPWAFGDPSALIIIPLLLLVPGPRDVLLTALRDIVHGMHRAKRFMKNDPPRSEPRWSKSSTGHRPQATSSVSCGVGIEYN